MRDLRSFGLLVRDLKALAAPACAARSGGREKHKQKSSSDACCDPLPSATDAPFANDWMLVCSKHVQPQIPPGHSRESVQPSRTDQRSGQVPLFQDTKKPAEDPDEDEIKPLADYFGGTGGPLSRGECISNLVLGEIYRLKQA